MNNRPLRIGQIVPSSNTTMETEIPALLRARESVAPERFTFHSSRMRMLKVTKAELEATDGQADRCAQELSDAARAPLDTRASIAEERDAHGMPRLAIPKES